MLEKEVEVLWIARYDYQTGWKLKNHSHNYYQMIFIVDGYSQFFLDNDIHQASPGRLFLLKPGQLHGLITDESSV